MVDYAADIKAAVAALMSGGTLLYPTDTVWGIGCDATIESAVEKVFALKARPKEKSLIILLPEARDVLQYVAAPPPDIIDIIESFTTPTIELWAYATLDRSIAPANANSVLVILRAMLFPSKMTTGT